MAPMQRPTVVEVVREKLAGAAAQIRLKRGLPAHSGDTEKPTVKRSRRHWIREAHTWSAGGRRTSLCHANLSGADLGGVDLGAGDVRWLGANLSHANLHKADLSMARAVAGQSARRGSARSMHGVCDDKLKLVCKKPI